MANIASECARRARPISIKSNKPELVAMSSSDSKMIGHEHVGAMDVHYLSTPHRNAQHRAIFCWQREARNYGDELILCKKINLQQWKRDADCEMCRFQGGLLGLSLRSRDATPRHTSSGVNCLTSRRDVMLLFHATCVNSSPE